MITLLHFGIISLWHGTYMIPTIWKPDGITHSDGSLINRSAVASQKSSILLNFNIFGFLTFSQLSLFSNLSHFVLLVVGKPSLRVMSGYIGHRHDSFNPKYISILYVSYSYIFLFLSKPMYIFKSLARLRPFEEVDICKPWYVLQIVNAVLKIS